MKKLTFVSFQSIINNVPNGMVKFMYNVFISFNRYEYKKTYYLSYNDSNNSEIKSIAKIYRYLTKLLNIINRLLPLFNSGSIRFMQEKLFDYILSFSYEKGTIIISSAIIPKTLQKSKNVKIFLAGNPDDFQIHNIILEEMAQYHILLKDAYTNVKRINYISKSILNYDHIICFTTVQYESFIKRIEKDRVSLCEAFIIPNETVFESKVIKKNEILTFCYIAHPFWLKGLHYLLESWSSVKDERVKLRIGGRMDGQLKKYIDNNFGDLNGVEFTGWVKDLNIFYRSSHVCIIPSILDAGPATIAEAMYCGLPVIVTEGCGSRTLVENGKTGFIVPSRNSQTLAEKIVWFIKNQDKISEMGMNANMKIQSLKKEDQYQKVADHIQNVINSLN